MNAPETTFYFLNYQREWLADASRLKLCQKGRQVGLSYVDSFDSVRKAAMKPGRDVWVMSRDEAQARQYIRYCRWWAAALQHVAIERGERAMNSSRKRPAALQTISFATGASIYALSSNPDAIVGKTGHVKLDEFALHKDQRTLYAVAKPVIQWGGTLSVISTHRGAGTVFNELVTDIRERGNRMGWSLHTVPIQRAVEDGLVEKIDRSRAGTGEPARDAAEAQQRRRQWLEQQRAECIDEEQWLQEYCCVPADEGAAFISYELINGCTEPGCLRDFAYLASCPNPIYLGVDVARKEDLCVLDAGEKIGDVVWDRLRIELRGRPFGEIEEWLHRLLGLRQVRRACLDATGMGMQLAERARERFRWKVEPITFTTQSKEALATGLKMDLENRQVRLADDAELRADLRGIRKEPTLGGHHRYAGESEGSHCDRFWAKALRQQAARFKIAACARVG